MSRKLIKSDVIFLINIKVLYCIICTSLLISSYVGNRVKGVTLNLLDYLTILFSGPGVDEYTLLVFFTWFLPLVVFMYGIFNFLYYEWDGKYQYTILRIKSIDKWIVYKINAFIIYTIIYVSIFYISAIIIGVFMGFSINETSRLQEFYPNIRININIYSLHLLNMLMVVINLIFIAVVSFFASYIFKKNIYSYLVVCLIYTEPYFSFFFTTKNLILFPAEHAIFARHYILNSNLNSNIYFSYLYMLFIAISILTILSICMKKFDLS